MPCLRFSRSFAHLGEHPQSDRFRIRADYLHVNNLPKHNTQGLTSVSARAIGFLWMSDHPAFDVIAPVYRSRHVLGRFLEGLDVSVPVILVDNSAGDEDLSDLIAQYANVRYIDSGGNLGFSAASNLGAAASTADFFVFMNPDTRPTADALSNLVRYLDEHPGVASAGAAGVDTEGGGAQPTMMRMLIHSLGLHRVFRLSGVYFSPRHDETLDVGWISGSCLAIRRSAFESVGGFDPTFFVYMSDVDLGNRLRRKGLLQVLHGGVVVPHDDGGSSDISLTAIWERRGRGWTLFLRRNHPVPSAFGLTALFVLGLAARTLLYASTGRRMRAREMWTYLSSAIAEWVSPELPNAGA